MSDEIDFDYINEIGTKINQILFNDPDQSEWVDEVLNEVNENGAFPEDTSSHLVDYMSNSNDTLAKSLVDDVNRFVNDEDNVDNFLNAIFFPQEIVEEEDIIDVPIPEEEEEAPTINEADLDPEAYFENLISKVMKTLFLSHDVAYALLNKFDWNQIAITKDWFTNQEEILKSLRIKQGSELVPDLKSPLSMKSIGAGDCPICDNEAELFQLYCGHVLCKDCLFDEIQAQILENKPPLCRQTDENNKLCNAEIMSEDVKKILNDDLYQKYKKVILNHEIAIDNDVKLCPCPYCDWIITPANSLPCHVGKCPRCNAVTCQLEDHPAHAPLINCDKIDDFTIHVASEMQQLEDDQEAWFAREERLKDYRQSHINEVQKCFQQSINQLKQKQYDDGSEERKRIADLDKVLEEYLSKIADLRRKANSYLDQQKSSDEVRHIMSEIDYLNEEYNKKSELKSLYCKDQEMKNKERNKDLNTAQQESQFFISALQSSSQYQYYMLKFRESQDMRAYQKVNVSSNDEDYIKKIAKKCPKCKTLIQRDEGCNYMKCYRCNFEFCWACEESWNPTHSNHWQCPKYKLSHKGNTKKTSSCNIDFNDFNDKTFYPQPMSIEKRAAYMRWKNLYSEYRLQNDKYNDLYKKFMNFTDAGKADFQLSSRNKLIKALNKDTNESESELNALRIMNIALFAQSVIMWSSPALYYMNREPQKARVFEFKISTLAEKKDNLINMIDEAPNLNGSEIMTHAEALEKSIEIILDDAVIF